MTGCGSDSAYTVLLNVHNGHPMRTLMDIHRRHTKRTPTDKTVTVRSVVHYSAEACKTFGYTLVIVALLCTPVQGVGVLNNECTNEEANLIRECNPDLNAISTAILAMLPGDSNYTKVCEQFYSYVTCKDPKAHSMPTACHKAFLEPYVSDRLKYSSLPYNCTNITNITEFHTEFQTELIVNGATSLHTTLPTILAGTAVFLWNTSVVG